MVKHIVMWRLRDFAAGATKIENCRKLKAKLEVLPAVIPDLERLEVGINFDGSAAAFDVALTATFEDVRALRRYQAHPEHQKLVNEFLKEVRTEKIVVDYEF